MKSMAYSVPSYVRRELRDLGARRALRSALFEIELLGIDKNEFIRVKECIERMIKDWPNT